MYASRSTVLCAMFGSAIGGKFNFGEDFDG
jgi:hypothetical protein